MGIRQDMQELYGGEGDDGLLFFSEPEYDAAIIGIAVRCGMEDVVVYDRDKLVEIIHKRDGCYIDDASEWVSINIEGAYVGPRTPIILHRWWGH